MSPEGDSPLAVTLMGAPGTAKRLELGQVFEAPDGTRREVLGIDDQGRIIVRTTTAIEPSNLRLWIRRTGAICPRA